MKYNESFHQDLLRTEPFVDNIESNAVSKKLNP